MKIIISAKPLAVRQGLINIRNSLTKHGSYSPDEINCLEIVLAEILNNIVEHAYEASENGLIEIQIFQAVDGLWCDISDNGDTMPQNRIPAGQLTDLDGPTSDLPEGGFGWFLIRHFTHTLTYTRENCKNRTTFRMNCNLHAEALSPTHRPET